MSLDVSILWSDEPFQITGKKPAIVITDVLRASTTIAVALNQGAKRVIIAKEPEEAFEIKRALPQAILAGERGGRTIDGFDASNSPYFVSKLAKEKDIILCTGNTTSVIGRFVKENVDILSAGFINASVTIDYLVSQNYDQIIFLAVGTYRMGKRIFTKPKRTHEDYFGSGYLCRLLEKRTNLSFNCIERHRDLLDNSKLLIGELKETEYAKYLVQIDQDNIKDIDIAFKIDSYGAVCRLEELLIEVHGRSTLVNKFVKPEA